MRRKLTALLLSAALAASLAAPALAAEDHMSNFKKTAVYASAYSDVWSGAWYGSAAKLCYDYGLMHGTWGKFNPRGTVSVAEALAIADRIHQIYTTGKSTLKSAGGDQWYRPYVDYALQNRILAEGDFTDYTRSATRGEVARIFADALPPAELHAINDIDHLSDVPMGKAYYSVLLLYNAGVLTGSGPDCRFRPDDTITRAEIAAVASRMILPRERVEFMLLDAQDLGDVIPGLTVYMPGLREMPADETLARFAAVANAAKQYRCEVSAANYATLDSAKDVTQLSKSEAKNGLSAALAAAGFTVDIASVRAGDVSFGPLKAYRYTFRADGSDGAQRLGFAYTFIKDGAFCTVSYLALRDSAEFRTAIDALTVDGASHT